MSRVGKKPIKLPDGVTVIVKDSRAEVKGPKGALSVAISPDIEVSVDGNIVSVSMKRNSTNARRMWGTTRALLSGAVIGVERAYEKKLQIEGVGYKVALKGKDLELSLGFSHPVIVSAPNGIEYKVEKNIITVCGISKEEVGKVAAYIRSLKKPEPYKGKGIRYEGEIIRRKAGKKAVASE